MDIKQVAFIVVTIFAVIIINVFIDLQTSGAIESVDYSSSRFGDSLKGQSYALHLINDEESLVPGRFDESDFERLLDDCEIRSNLEDMDDSEYNFGGSDTDVNLETQENSCDDSESIRDPVVLGIETINGGDSKIEKVLIR